VSVWCFCIVGSTVTDQNTEMATPHYCRSRRRTRFLSFFPFVHAAGAIHTQTSLSTHTQCPLASGSSSSNSNSSSSYTTSSRVHLSLSLSYTNTLFYFSRPSSLIIFFLRSFFIVYTYYIVFHYTTTMSIYCNDTTLGAHNIQSTFFIPLKYIMIKCFFFPLVYDNYCSCVCVIEKMYLDTVEGNQYECVSHTCNNGVRSGEILQHLFPERVQYNILYVH